LKTMVAKDDLLILPVLLSSSPSMPIFGNRGVLRILVVDKLWEWLNHRNLKYLSQCKFIIYAFSLSMHIMIDSYEPHKPIFLFMSSRFPKMDITICFYAYCFIMIQPNNLIWFEYWNLIGWSAWRFFFAILENLGWYCDVTNVFIRRRQIQIVTWNNLN
jgi:hypothetical protein